MKRDNLKKGYFSLESRIKFLIQKKELRIFIVENINLNNTFKIDEILKY